MWVWQKMKECNIKCVRVGDTGPNLSDTSTGPSLCVKGVVSGFRVTLIVFRQWQPFPYIVPYFWPGPIERIGLWSKVVHCVWNRVPFGMQLWQSPNREERKETGRDREETGRDRPFSLHGSQYGGYMQPGLASKTFVSTNFFDISGFTPRELFQTEREQIERERQTDRERWFASLESIL